MTDEPIFLRGYGWVKGEKMKETLMARAKSAITRNRKLETDLHDMANRAGACEVRENNYQIAIVQAIKHLERGAPHHALQVLKKIKITLAGNQE